MREVLTGREMCKEGLGERREVLTGRAIAQFDAGSDTRFSGDDHRLLNCRLDCLLLHDATIAF